MPDLPTDCFASLRADFGVEALAGFPRLRRIPQTGVVQFLDYFDDLGPEERSALLDGLALRGSAMINPSPASTYPPSAAFDRYREAVASRGPFVGGYRYTDVKFLASLPKIPEFGSLDAWVEKCQRPWVSERALRPREDLLPGMEGLVAAKTPDLRKRVKAALRGRGFVPQATKGSDNYVNDAGAVVRLDFGSYMGQLRYHVSAASGRFRFSMLSYESLWSQPGGWDYLTEENAARCIDFLPDLVDYLIRLPARLDGRTEG